MGMRACKRSRTTVTRFPETETLFVEPAQGKVVATRQTRENPLADLNAAGEPMSLTIEHVGIAPQDSAGDLLIEKNPRFLARIRQARESLKKGRGVRPEDIESPDGSDRTSHGSTWA